MKCFKVLVCNNFKGHLLLYQLGWSGVCRGLCVGWSGVCRGLCVGWSGMCRGLCVEVRGQLEPVLSFNTVRPRDRTHQDSQQVVLLAKLSFLYCFCFIFGILFSRRNKYTETRRHEHTYIKRGSLHKYNFLNHLLWS